MPFVSADNNHANEQRTWLLNLPFKTRNLFFGIMYFPFIKKKRSRIAFAHPRYLVPHKKGQNLWLKVTFIICNFSL